MSGTAPDPWLGCMAGGIWNTSCFLVERKHPTQTGRDLLGLGVTLRTPSRSGKGLSQEYFRLSSEASLCFINKYYPEQWIEPEIFKVLVSFLTAKLKTWYFLPLFVFCTCLVHLQQFRTASRTGTAETPTRLVGSTSHSMAGGKLLWSGKFIASGDGESIIVFYSTLPGDWIATSLVFCISSSFFVCKIRTNTWLLSSLS